MDKLRERYDNLDGLRAISCLLIIAYHVKKYGDYQISGVPADIIDLWTQFVPLFLLISGFGMFCGYYERMKNREISLSAFYKKRYAKILPFFAFVLLIYCVLEHSLSGLIEALTQATLTYGLLPNITMELCGVAWTIGMIFLFYMLFPFFVFLCDSKKTALIAFGISIVLSIFCYSYFFTHYGNGEFVSRKNFLYLAPYFMGGAVSFLFRDSIKRVISAHRIISLIVCILITVGYYFIPGKILGINTIVLKNLLLFLPWLWYSISVKSNFGNESNQDFSRLGLIAALDPRLGNVEWLGRGPHENYPDRKTSAFMGVWNSTVNGMAEEYEKPQSMGERCDVKWVTFTDDKGEGVRFRTDGTFDFSALHYTDEDLWQTKYLHELSKIHRPEIILHLDAAMRGLGNASCGPGPLPKYELKEKSYSYSFVIEPIKR